ncbi:Vps62-related protein [Chengkuizengella axinellae]|uniref:Vps62-related protein n=1 Tax=Chengkuizengella axinellae TaxID=3064388 RepID=A0ABT9IWC2_9BACL|nr:Vps62-related protein [Chengkuizengella sp. 2205SS18-9]MDP5273633.1 Vps62-related protein [Chengkuizengella sp. 2205SS18-9]
MMNIQKLKLVMVLFISFLLVISLMMTPVHSAEIDQYIKMPKSTWEGDLGSAKSYVQVLEYGDYIGLNFRFFYPYNGNIGGAGLFPSGAHEGDWESVKILVNKNSDSIEQIRPSAHDNEHGWKSPSIFEYESGHPVIYSAEHSHANYWTEGKHTRLSGFGNDYTSKTHLWDIPNDNFIIINEQNTPWMDFQGRWGASGSTDAQDDCGFTCPNSPRFSSGYNWFIDVTNATQSSDITNLGEVDVTNAYLYAKEYAPVVYLQVNEQYFPSTVEWLLKQAPLKENGSVLLDVGELNSWSLVGKSSEIIPLDFTNYNTSAQSEITPKPTEDKDEVFELSALGSDTKDYVNKTIYINPQGNTYTFGVWLKTTDGSMNQQVSLRLRSQGNLNGGNGDHDFLVTFNVTNEWTYYSVSETFDEAADWIRTTIYPVGYQNSIGNVLASKPLIVQDMDFTSFNPSDFSEITPTSDVDKESSFELSALGIDTTDYMNRTFYINPDGKTFTFGVWLKTLNGSTNQTVSLRLRSQGNQNGGNGDNDQLVTFDVTDVWAYYTVTERFDVSANWIRTTIYPNGKQNGTGSILASEPVLSLE